MPLNKKPKRAPFFAQMSTHGRDHRATYFWTVEDARRFLAEHDGGEIKHRGSGQYGWDTIEVVPSKSVVNKSC